MSERGIRARHPWHPALVHFPIACWMLGAGIDLLGLIMLVPELPGIEPAALSHALIWAGNAFAVPTVIAGLVDYARLPSTIQDGAMIKRHMAWMGSAWLLFLFVAIARFKAGPFEAAVSTWVVFVELAGAVCLAGGGWAAAKVVFVEMVARPRPH